MSFSRGEQLLVLATGVMASIVIAISALLPKNEDTARWTQFTVVGVTALIAVAMISYPVLACSLNRAACNRTALH